jgi:hypothetical protein
MKWFKYITIISIFPLLSFYEGNQTEWQLQRNKNNISIYSRDLQNGSRMEMKAETVLDVPLSNMVAMVQDVEFYPNWMYRCSESRIIKRVSETEFYYYLVTTVPWPVSNRDMVVHVLVSQNDSSGTVEFDLHGIPDYIDEVDGIVRVQVFEGKWILKPLSGGKIQVIQKLMVAPTGALPTWMVNLAAIEGPYGTMVGMVEKVGEQRFSNKHFDFLKK